MIESPARIARQRFGHGRTRSKLLFGAILLATLAHGLRADACSCVMPPGVKEAFAASGTVFEGKVVSIRHEPKQHRITARLEVLRRWKGAQGKTVEVVTVDEGSLCGFGFERGQRYLLFAHEAEGTVSVSLCSRSKASADSAQDIAELDRLAGAGATTPDAAPPPPSDPTPAPPPPPAATAEKPETGAAPITPAAPSPGASDPRPRGGCAGCSIPEPGAASPALVLLGLVVALVRRRAR